MIGGNGMNEGGQDKKIPLVKAGTFYYAGPEPKIRRGGRGSVRGYIAAALIASIITCVVVVALTYGVVSEKLDYQQKLIESLQASSSERISEDKIVTDIVEKTSASMVGIRITLKDESVPSILQSQGKSEGSGIIISEDGYIATNYHVVSYMDPDNSYSSVSTMEVFLSDGKQVQAEFIGGDEQTDLAVIKINAANLTPVNYGDSSKLRAGEMALVIGNPLGISFAGSVTKGCISAVNRTINTGKTTLTLIQTDAAVNPGNSGGALLNSDGKVVGIVNAKISETDVEGLGFAIPINDAKPILEQLKENGYVKGRPFIGITGTQVTEAISKQYGIPTGVYVVSVEEKSAAEAAGLKQGDVIVQMEGKAIASMSDIEEIKKGHKPGDAVSIKIVRNGKEMTVKLVFDEDKR